MLNYREMTIEHLGSEATHADLIAFREACDAVLPYFTSSAEAGLLDEDTDPDQAATEYVWNNGRFTDRLYVGACIYCHALVADRTIVPAVDDNEGWDLLQAEHVATSDYSDDECEWIATRAHRLENSDA